jgi:hypothetical protein
MFVSIWGYESGGAICVDSAMLIDLRSDAFWNCGVNGPNSDGAYFGGILGGSLTFAGPGVIVTGRDLG